MKLPFISTIICTTVLASCSWIEQTKESEAVMLVNAGQVIDCHKLGTTHATVTRKIGILTRDDAAVTDDLIIVAKNKAAEMGGDSIVARSENVEGKMSFDIYQCSKP